MFLKLLTPFPSVIPFVTDMYTVGDEWISAFILNIAAVKCIHIHINTGYMI